MFSTLPNAQETCLEKIKKTVKTDNRFKALLAGGSLVHGGFDIYSDLDLVLVVQDESYQHIMSQRRQIAQSFGNLLACFSGEHVGEPRLLICLYGPDTVHVDLKFITIDALDVMIERPLLIWSDGVDVEERINKAQVSWPNQTAEWFEDRFWIWIHYGAVKVARGELYEAIGMLCFIREQILGPLIHQHEGRPQRGVRRLEQLSQPHAVILEKTLATHDKASVLSALHSTVELYKKYRDTETNHSPAEEAVLCFLSKIK